jgi:hypothetical protein
MEYNIKVAISRYRTEKKVGMFLSWSTLNKKIIKLIAVNSR